MKAIKQSELNDILYSYFNEDEISLSKVTELINKKADNFAIRFLIWVWGNCFNIFNNRFLYKDDEYSSEELLEIYKKEKGL